MKFRKSLSVVLIIINCFAFVYLLYFHYLILSNPYPQEQRDSIPIVTTNLMLSGINPFSYKAQPMGTNTYGILQNILTLPLAKIYGSNLFTHKLVTGIFILATIFVFALILIHKKVKLGITVSLVTIFYASLLFDPIPYTRGDSIGLFFFLLGLYIAYVNNFSRTSLILSYIIGILGVLTKTYYLLLYLFILAYLYLFRSFKKGIEQTIIVGVLIVGAFIIVDKILPVYWTNTYFSALNSIPFTPEHFRKRLFLFFLVYSGVFISLLINLLKSQKESRKMSDFFNFCILASSFVFVVKLGGNAGAGYSYYFELISPFLLPFVGKLASQASDKRYIISHALITLNILALIYFFHMPFNKNDYSAEWENARKLIASHTNIIAPNALATLIQEENKTLYDSGNTEFFKYGWERTSFYKLFLKPDLRAKQIAVDYQSKIDDMVANQKFDLIITYSPLTDEIKVSKRYENEGTLVLHAPSDGQKLIWKYKIWIPKPSTELANPN